MRKFLSILLSIVLVVMCGCSVARLYFDVIEQQNKFTSDEAQELTPEPEELTPEPEELTPEPEELTPVYTYLHSGFGVLILESNTKTGEVTYCGLCPRCGNIGNRGTTTATSYKIGSQWCPTCQDSHDYAIQVTIYEDYQ